MGGTGTQSPPACGVIGGAFEVAMLLGMSGGGELGGPHEVIRDAPPGSRGEVKAAMALDSCFPGDGTRWGGGVIRRKMPPPPKPPAQGIRECGNEELRLNPLQG